MKKKFVINRIGIFALLIIALGCQGATPPQSAKPDAAAPASAGAPTPAATEQKAEPKVEKEVYVYDPKGRRDPFVSLATVTKEKPQRKMGASAIENFDVDEIQLIAIAWDSKSYFAQVVTPDRKSYTLRKGMKIGLYGGTVANITSDSVVIREEVTDYRGQKKAKDTILKLRKEGVE